MADSKKTDIEGAGMSTSDVPPAHSHEEGSASENMTPLPQSKEFGEQLVFVETRVDHNGDSENIYRHSTSGNLYFIGLWSYHNRHNDLPKFAPFPVEVVPIDLDQSIPEITKYLVDATLSENSDHYYSGHSFEARVGSLAVCWQGQQTARRWETYDKSITSASGNCFTLLTGKKDHEVRNVFRKMAARGWQDHLVIFYDLISEIKPKTTEASKA